jgi:hypothetical protein
VIRDVVIHLLNEQPVMADLLVAPAAGDANLLCTNLRTLAGRRPVFVDDSASTFVFPYRHIRFLEIRPEGSTGAGVAAAPAEADAGGAAPAPEADLEIDEDFLRRIREA